MSEEVEHYRNSHKRVDISNEELESLLVRHQYGEHLSDEERSQLWQFISNFVRSLERRYFGKQDSYKELDLHHERVLYVHDYLRERRVFEHEEHCTLTKTGLTRCRKKWVPSNRKQKPFRMLYKLRLTWGAHEAVIRLGNLGIDWSTFEPITDRNKFEIAEITFMRYDVTSVLKMQRLYETYDRDELIELALNNNARAKRFRKSKHFKKPLGVEPFVDLLLFAVAHRYGYKQLSEERQQYDYFKPLQGSKGRKVWSAHIQKMDR